MLLFWDLESLVLLHWRIRLIAPFIRCPAVIAVYSATSDT